MRTLGTILTAALLLAACGDSFTIGGDDTCDCCGTEVSISSGETCFSGVCDPYCGIVQEDAGAADAGAADAGAPDCPMADPRALDVICPSLVRAGEPTTIPIAIGGDGGCYCGERIDCEVRRGDEPNTLELRANVCIDGPLCEACFPYIESTCTLPALEEGRWTVRDRGETAFTFDVVSPDVMPEWGLECVSARGEDALGCGLTWPPTEPLQASRACHPGGVFAEQRVELTVTDGCGTCGTTPGPCEVEIFDDVLRVRPSRVESMCDIGCPAVCMEVDSTCTTPPMPAGVWRVFVGDVEIGTQLFVSGPGDEPPDPDEVCGELLTGG